MYSPLGSLSLTDSAAFLIVFISSQDWDFPYFDGGMDIKLPGLNTGNFHFHLPGGDIRISGKWFNYGIIFIVMILDMNMWKNQIFYEPFVYGQYTDNQDYICTVDNRDFLANATMETLSYAWRWSHVNPLTNNTYGVDDQKMNSRYIGFPLSAKGTAFIPSLVAFAVFGILVKYYSKGGPPMKVAPTEEHDAADGSAEERNVADDVGDSSSSPHVTESRQSMASSKSAFTANKARNIGSFVSIDSSRVGLNASRDNGNSSRDNLDSSRDNLDSSRDIFDSSRDNLNSSRDNLESSRDNLESSHEHLRSSVESLGFARKNTVQSTSSRPAWSADSPMKMFPNKSSRNKRSDSSDTEKSIKRPRCSNDNQDNENMVQELEQELSFLNLQDLESQTKDKKPADGNFLSAADDNSRSLSFGDLFRRDLAPSSSKSQLSVTSSEEDVKPEVKTRNNFLQVPRAK